MNNKLLLEPHSAPDIFWRSLQFFSLYRLAVSLMFFAAVIVSGDVLSVGIEDPTLFVRSAILYVIAAMAFLAAVRRKRNYFNLQLSVQVATDILLITLMMYASGGQKSGIGVLLMVVVAGAGLVGQGRLTLFYAALASLSILMEQSWRALVFNADAADFARSGFTCLGFFGTAITAQLLARRVVANETLAVERGKELASQLRIGERIIRDMTDGVLVVGPDGKIKQANPPADRLLGCVSAGLYLSDVSATLALRFSVWSVNRLETVETMRLVRGKSLRVRYLPAQEQMGNALLYIEDIERLEQQAQELKLAALGRLTANIAHEIRNPLAAISHAAELLREDETDVLRRRLAEIVGDNTARLNKLVAQVLELGRRDSADRELLQWSVFFSRFREEFSLHDPDSVRRIVDAGGDGSFRFDRGHLYRVLWNLFGNALRHATKADGGVRVELCIAENVRRVELNIMDDGPGIDVSMQGQVFEPFVTTQRNGTGLGLYIARELCASNGAYLELVPSQVGAHFRISFEEL
ncbi:MAG: HAMP domain-containing histidine kinase [Rhodocyclaceae bacterium]|nr:HAMP domain-containing histidine kinase [Rhodocyclaceae bacterium]MBP7080165.1 HAMP domain-containing histidine kinase [Rhodocyclaceae bacterium]